MADNDESRRRAGDETRQRIRELAAGWTLPAPEADQGPEAAAAPGGPIEVDDLLDELRVGTDVDLADDPDDATHIDSPRAEPAAFGARLRSEGTPTADAVLAMARGADRRRPAPSRTGPPPVRPGLPCRRGLAGDLRYVATVTFGVARARRELTHVEAELAAQRGERRQRLIEAAAAALTDETLAHPALADAGHRLLAIEDRRAREAGQAAAALARVDAVRRDHDGDRARLEREVAAIEAEIVDVTTQLGPLDQRAGAAGAGRRRQVDPRAHRRQAAGLARKQRAQGAGDASDAELAVLRADCIAVARDEPGITAELDALLPRIAELEAGRSDAQDCLKRTRAYLIALGDELQERLRAIQAAKKVIDRAVAATTLGERDRALTELGERLAHDRTPEVEPLLRDVDRLDVAIAAGDCRLHELRDVLGSIDGGARPAGCAPCSWWWPLVALAWLTWS